MLSSALAVHLREAYVEALAEALAQQVLTARCNWARPQSATGAPLPKLCFECPPATDGVAPVESQCCLAGGVRVEPATGTEHAVPNVTLGGRFCHRVLWHSCEAAADPGCCDVLVGAEARFGGSADAALAGCAAVAPRPGPAPRPKCAVALASEAEAVFPTAADEEVLAETEGGEHVLMRWAVRVAGQ